MKINLKTLAGSLLLMAASAFSQTHKIPYIDVYGSDPTGVACNSGNFAQYNGGLYPCVNGVYAKTTALSAAGLGGGALGSVPYQTNVGATDFIASPTTSGHIFSLGWQPAGSAVLPNAVDLTTNFLGLGGGVLTGPLNLPVQEGALFADQWQTSSGSNNGIAMSLAECQTYTYACQVLAPALYATLTPSGGEAQPWSAGLIQAVSPNTRSAGPASTAPLGCVQDQRYGGPIWICNGGLPNPYVGGGGGSIYSGPTSQSRFISAWPQISMTSTVTGNGITPLTPGSLELDDEIFSNGAGNYGGRDDYIEETYQRNLWLKSFFHVSGSHYAIASDMANHSPGDSIGLFSDMDFVGTSAAQNEGADLHIRYEEMGDVWQGTYGSSSCAAGNCTLNLTQTAGVAGGLGAELSLVDLSQAYTTGYIATKSGGTITLAGGASLSGLGPTATSTYTTLTVAVDNGAAGYNTFPKSATVSVASTSGFVVGQIACYFSNFDVKWGCGHVTAIGSGTLTFDQINFPMQAGSWVSTGGIAGWGFSADADTYDPSNPNGVGQVADWAPALPIRQVFPILGNTASNQLIVYTGGTGSAQGTISLGWQSKVYPSMGGSGGSCSVTVTGGAVTAVTATGGSGYISATSPPQLVLSGITYTTAPVIDVTGISSGVLTSAGIVNAGSGISGTPTCTVVTSNPYHIFPQTQILDAYNHAAGTITGNGLTTGPLPFTPASGDLFEQEHYFNVRSLGTSQGTQLYGPPGTSDRLFVFSGGSFATNDYEAYFINTNNISLYAALPSSLQRNTVGLGQLGTPHGIVLRGAHRNALYNRTPSFAAGGQDSAALFQDFLDQNANWIGSSWNAFAPLIGVANSTGSADQYGYNPVTSTWEETAGATGWQGQNSTCTREMTPTGAVYVGAGCNWSQDAAGNAFTVGTIANDTGGFGTYQNLLLYSQFDPASNPGLGAPWYSYGAGNTYTADTTDIHDPLGGNTALKIQAAAGGGIFQVVSLTSSVQYTVSVWFYGPAGTYSFGFDDGHNPQFTISAGQANTWIRIHLTDTAPFPNGRGFEATSVSGQTFYLWGAELQPGGTPGIYTRTTSAAVPATEGAVISGASACTSGTGCAPTGTAGGDLGGTYPNPSVTKINGGSVPASQDAVGTNSSGQLVAAIQHGSYAFSTPILTSMPASSVYFSPVVTISATSPSVGLVTISAFTCSVNPVINIYDITTAAPVATITPTATGTFTWGAYPGSWAKSNQIALQVASGTCTALQISGSINY